MKEIQGFKGYFIDKKGVIYSTQPRANQLAPKIPRIIKTFNSFGYMALHLQTKTGAKKRFVHRLLLETFVRKSKKGEQCRHLNGKRNDNRLENLKWGTVQENQLDRKIHGTSNNGEKHPLNKYKKEFIEKIKTMNRQGKRNIDIAKELKIPQSTVSWIIIKGWK